MSRRMDWLVGWWTEDDGNGFGQGTDAATVELDLVSQANLELYEDDLLVERIIGQWMVWNATESPVLFQARIHVLQDTSETVNIHDFYNADMPFLWHKVLLLEADQTNMQLNTGAHPEWSHIDVRVNRRLGDTDRLVFSLRPRLNVPFRAVGTWYWAAWIRVLVKHS